MYVPDNSLKIRVIVNRFAFKSILKQMSFSLIFNIIPINIFASDSFKNLFYGFFFELHQQMYMVTHQAIGKNLVFAYCLISFYYFDEFLIIFFIFKYLLLIDSSQHNVICFIRFFLLLLLAFFITQNYYITLYFNRQS